MTWVSFRLSLAAPFIAMAMVGCSDLGTPLKLRAQATVSAASLDFGTVAVNGTATRTLTVGNSGTAALVGSAALACAEYQLVSGAGPFTIAPGGSKEFVIRFAPGVVGSFPCSLELGAEIPAVAIFGAAADQVPGALCTVYPDHFAFGPIAVGQAVGGSFQVLSVGTAPLLVNVVSTSADYVVVSGGGVAEIPAGKFITVVVEFHPQAGRLRPGAISVGPGCPEVPASGIGVTVSLRNDLHPILSARCNESCHDHLFLDPTYGYQTLRSYVVVLDPDASTLYQYISGYYNTAEYGYYTMPPGGTLIPQAERDKFREWIYEGATDN